MLTMPEALLLLALNDEKGSLHPAAFLAIDHGLRGAALADLRSRGRLVSKAGTLRRVQGDPLPTKLLARSVNATRDVASPGEVSLWLAAMERELPDIRDLAASRLLRNEILVIEQKSRKHELETARRMVMRDGAVESSIHQQLIAGAEQKEEVHPWVGTLLALVYATNLTRVVFRDRAARKRARDLARWVIKRDSIAAAVDVVIQKTQGTWEA